MSKNKNSLVANTVDVHKGIMYDGLNFKSNLEVSCYKMMKEKGLVFKYEPIKFIVANKFRFENKCYERIGKKFKETTNGVILPITYTPDFIIFDENEEEPLHIIETKGWATSDFKIKFKLFKQYLSVRHPKAVLYKPSNKTEILECIKIILNSK